MNFIRRDGHVWECGSDERGGSKQHEHYGYDSGGECRCGDRDGDGEQPKRESS